MISACLLHNSVMKSLTYGIWKATSIYVNACCVDGKIRISLRHTRGNSLNKMELVRGVGTNEFLDIYFVALSQFLIGATFFLQ
jgi:hypothetical protein